MAEEALDVCCEQAALYPLCPVSPGRAAAGPLPSPNSFLLPFYDPELPPIHLPARAAASPHPMPARPGGIGEAVWPQGLPKSEAAGRRRKLHRAHQLERCPGQCLGLNV